MTPTTNLFKGMLRWFDPRNKQVGTLAYIANRLAGIGLTLYLFMHLVALGQLAMGPEAYNGFIKMMHQPLFIAGEFLVVVAVFLHGLNGIRIALNSFGVGTQYQKHIFYVSLVITIVVSAFFAVRMFGGG